MVIKGQYILFEDDIYFVEDCLYISAINDVRPFAELTVMAIDNVNAPRRTIFAPIEEIVLY